MPATFTRAPVETERKDPGFGGKPPVARRPTAGVATVRTGTIGLPGGVDPAISLPLSHGVVLCLGQRPDVLRCVGQRLLCPPEQRTFHCQQ